MSGASLTGRILAPRRKLNWARLRGPVTIIAIFATVFATLQAISPGALSYFDVTSLANGGATLALVAIGQTIIILTRGFDLSAGAVISLVNVTVASIPQETLGGQILAAMAGIGVGAAVGAFNGLFVGFLRLPSIVVTLATMFLVRGLTLLIMPSPGGMVGSDLTALLTGDAVPGFLPSSIVVLGLALAVWMVIKGSRFGTALYAVGSDPEAAAAIGLPLARTRFMAFTLGGAFYGAAGVFISAQIGAADPLVGDPILLQSFAAVVLGGTSLAGGRGGAVGSVFGAYTLMLLVNILLALDVSAYYSTVVEGLALLIAALVGLIGPKSQIHLTLQQITRRLRVRRAVKVQREGIALPNSAPSPAGLVDATHKGLARHQTEFLRMVMPSWAIFAVILIVTQLVFGGSTIFSMHFYNSLIALTSFLAILALGQGSVVLAGGLDLSLPWTIAFCGILGAGLMNGSNEAAVWAVPVVLAVGAVIGLLNGLGVAALGLPPIVMTLAMNGLLQGAALVYSNGTPAGITAPALRWLMTGTQWGISPMIPLLVLFVAFALVLLTRTTFARRVYAVGTSRRAAFLSGVNVGRVTVTVYALSGVCSALVGVMLTGFGGQASLGMGDVYLLPSIAVIIIGGTAITGGKGHYLGMLGGALLLTALQTLLTGTTLPPAFRDIVFGFVVLGAILSLRETH